MVWKCGTTGDISHCLRAESHQRSGDIAQFAVLNRDLVHQALGSIDIEVGCQFNSVDAQEHPCRAVNGGTLTAYRWSGEQRINPANYVPLVS